VTNRIPQGPCQWGSIQVSREHYYTSEYLSQARFLGLHAQLHACLNSGRGKSILEIGPGPGLLTALLRHLGHQVTTVDLAPDLRPDTLARLPELPLRSRSVDVACAFEVLEHIPFELLPDCLREMGRVASQRILFTVPDQKEIYRGECSIRLVFGNKHYHKLFWRRALDRLTNPHEHFWEVGFAGISPKEILDIGERAGLTPVSTYFVKPWFRFFVFSL